MKLLSFIHEGRRTYGVLNDRGMIGELGGGRVPGAADLKGFLALDRAEQSRAAAAAEFRIAQSSIAYLPVIPNPDKIFCAGSNYHDHRLEAGRKTVAYPGIFLRLADSLAAHDQPMHLSQVSSDLDYEAELAVVIGKPGRYIKEEDALDHVAGYACFNDASFRDWQRHTHQITPGKNFPGTGALGPYLVTRDEVGDVSALHLQARLNGQVMQSAPVADMIFGVAQLIAYCSGFTPLAVGDVIATGTPGGVGFLRDPPLYVKEGDVVEIEIDGLGVLRNRIAGPV
jgi:2-keto-4-pentenoate hydratase/2-oxohepta-3-ene-1,7-dioic acid hydratase in catechol pathway